MRILLVEDDEILATTVSDFLRQQHYVMDLAIDGELGWDFLATYTYDLVLLDVMLPKLDGMSLCRKLRTAGHQMPVLLLTAKQTSDDKVMGLDVGADDYLVKPFDLKELAARIRALFRRSSSALSPLLEWGKLQLDPSICRVTYDEEILKLSNKEYSLLELFLRNSRRVLNRSTILDHLWAGEDVPTEDTVKAHIKGLRRKFRSVGAPEDLIENIYGLGYRLKPLELGTDPSIPQIVMAGLSPQISQHLEDRLDSFCNIKVLETSSATLEFLHEGLWQLLILDQALLTPPVVKVLSEAYSRLQQGNQTIIYCLESDGVKYLPRKILGQILMYPFGGEELAQVIEEILHLSVEDRSLMSRLEALPALRDESPCPTTIQVFPQSMQESVASLVPALESSMADLWEKFKDVILQRLQVLEKSKVAIFQGDMQEGLREQAIAEAHKLAGSLGTFGFPTGTDYARKIENLLLENPSLSLAQKQELISLIENLQGLLRAKTPAVITDSTPTNNSSITATNDPRIEILPSNSRSFYINHPRLLIVEDDQELAQQLAVEARSWGMDVEVVHDLSNTYLAIAKNPPDLVLLDLVVSEASETGLDLLRFISAKTPPIPAIVLTSRDSFPHRLEVARLGGCGFISKPISLNQVMQTVNQVLQQNNLEQFKVMIVDDDPAILSTLTSYFAAWSIHLTILDDPRNFWETLERFSPDLLVLDINMPYVNGFELCQVIRNDNQWHGLPVLFISSQDDQATIEKVFRVGADDFISKPLSEQVVTNRIFNRLQRLNFMRGLAEVDLLTGIANRRKFTKEWERLRRLSIRHTQSMCLAILDLDNFKLVNDRYGHETGDRVLHDLGKLLLRSFRPEDLIARWGGEEFVVGWYQISKAEAYQYLEKVLESLRALEFTAADGRSFRISFSAGLVQYPEDGDNFSHLYHRADHLLYQAKQMGRDRILCS